MATGTMTLNMSEIKKIQHEAAELRELFTAVRFYGHVYKTRNKCQRVYRAVQSAKAAQS